MRHRILDTFTGPFAIMEDTDGTLTTMWVSREIRTRLASTRLDPRLHPELARRLKAYFGGDEAVTFDDVQIPSRAGEFFRACWAACRRIPRGETVTYGELATKAGEAGAARAAGQAMRNNPLPIIVPCHRVIAAGGKLHGFAGSCNADGAELGIKRTLLEMEGWSPTMHDVQEGLFPTSRRRPRLHAVM